MIYKEHYIELFVNGQKLDLESQNSLNLRFQNVLYDPEKISSSQAEYSFEFEIPSTPLNDKIFDYTNNLSKLNKFRRRWDAEVYADGTIIFEGTLTLNGYKDKMYKCNLVSVKVYSLDDIFGDDVLTDIPWEIPFDGAGESGYSINYYNALQNTDVTFPLVSYGAFQKTPYNQDGIASDYTSKFIFDEHNLWYVESFPPSLNMLQTIRKAFEYKGYTVGGDAFQNVYLKEIFMSTNLADNQSPVYNLGNPKFGKVDLTVNWTNPLDGTGIFADTYGTTQELKFPYFKSGDDYWDCSQPGDCITMTPDYNLKEVKVYDMMSSTDGGSVTMNQSASYLYQPNEHLFVIPADGFYKITLEYNAQLLTTSQLTATQWVHKWQNGSMSMSVEEKDISFNPDFRITTPLEIQLVRNYDENLELIKGKNNMQLHDGYPDNTTECGQGRTTNYTNILGCFPHESPGLRNSLITKWNDLSIKYGPDYTYSDYGFVNGDGTLMCYDPAVSDIFIAGATSMGNKEGGGTAAVNKNGYSWSNSYAERQDNFYIQTGYYQASASSQIQTEHNKNEYPDAIQSYHSQNSNSMQGRVVCMMKLNKNDILQLMGVHRAYENQSGTSITYQTSATVRLSIEAASPNSFENLKGRGYGYNSPSDFSQNLKVTNFLNGEKKISEWIQNIVDAFNLDLVQDGKNIFVNVKKKFNRNLPVAVDIDNRVNSADAESSRIQYPKSMSVRYKIDDEEWGFERSVTPQSKLNDTDWKDYADSGYTVIELDDDEYETTKSEKNLQFSYTWYDNFTWYPINSSFDPDSGDAGEIQTTTIPVISKYTYMIDGYNYEESMKHDGYGLSQRFWFRPKPALYEELPTDFLYLWTRTYPVEKVYIYEPKNLYEGLNLSYKTTEPSLLQEYFNITPYLASNYVTVEAYLTPEEYKMLKNGASVHFDSDIYYPVELSGYDPSGYNKTEIKMIKKI